MPGNGSPPRGSTTSSGTARATRPSSGRRSTRRSRPSTSGATSSPTRTRTAAAWASGSTPRARRPDVAAGSLLRQDADRRRLPHLDAPLADLPAEQTVAVPAKIIRGVLDHRGKHLPEFVSALADADARDPEQLLLLVLP